eukprot:CAMPEP_0197029768 /NCGR_PEP_ID=MMETSP1384-20130603/9147_1 /TAXON_ID=29189 /ORGANISM="Ammonia sp." /LENGTH=210 /DNA_ID=CAMNT_0042458999 /DNA_START=871 /DNA_END=1504 /DNA_ORIENTATION=+
MRDVRQWQLQPAYLDVHDASPLPAGDGDHSTNRKSVAKDEEEEAEAQPESIPLYKYLQTAENYEQFSQCLAKCFALENLLFFMRVSCFRRTLLEMKRNGTENHQENEKERKRLKGMTLAPILTEHDEDFYDKWCPARSRKTIFALGFEYLPSNDDGIENFDMDAAALDIYNTFIVSNSMYEVNISYPSRSALADFLVKAQRPRRVTLKNI